MPQRPADLPDFSSPPLFEVILSVQFDQISAYRIVHFGEMWVEFFRNDYPKVVEQSPLRPVFETFGSQPTASQGLEIATGPLPLPRLWFISSDGAELVQFQPDRLIQNWRKGTSDAAYPRYEHVKSKFSDSLGKLKNFLRSKKMDDFIPNQCEITYVNHLMLDENSINLE